MARSSRRQFIAVSAATVLAGILPQKAFGNEVDAPSDRPVDLKAVGDARSGYHAVILFNDRPVARHTGEGEFSAVFQNADRSLEDRVQTWRASSYSGSENRLLLEGDCKLPNLKATIAVEVEYQLVASRVVRKQIRLHQADIDEIRWNRSSHRPLSGASISSNARGDRCVNIFPLRDFERMTTLQLACSPIRAIAMDGAGSSGAMENR